MVRVHMPHAPGATWVTEDARAVSAAKYGALDGGEGGIVRDQIADFDIGRAADFEIGAHVYLESDAPDDVLDDSDEPTEAATRIWWRATIHAKANPTNVGGTR